MILPGFGEVGQRRLAESRAVVVGCGALGTVAADGLVRAGVGEVTIIDRDVVEWTNLQRQTLFDERDAREGRPKAAAAAERLSMVNSGVRVEGIVADLHSGNVEELLGLGRAGGRLVVVDATDNFEARYLLNDACVKHGVPWVYGGAVGTVGMQATFIPGGGGPCLRCVFPEPGARGAADTCDTAGVLGPVAGIVANVQVVEAIKVLAGRGDLVSTTLLEMDPWNGLRRRIDLQHAKDPVCPCCVSRRFEFLEGVRRRGAGGKGTEAALCGRDAVQVCVGGAELDLQELGERLSRVGRVQTTAWFVRARVDDRHELTVFRDGRAIVKGTIDVGRARSLYARYVGV